MIRPYEDRDQSIVIDLWYQASLLAHPFLDDDFFERERTTIRETYIPATDVYVCEDGDALIGFFAVIEHAPDEAEVIAIFLKPGFQGQGHAKAMMDYVLSLYSIVWTDVFKENPVGRKFYARYGFEETFTHTDKRQGEQVIRLVHQEY